MTAPLPRLAVALDAPALEPLEPIIDELAGLPILAKVGLSLFCAVGPAVVHHLQQAGLAVFLDLKLHDIPHQVGLAVRAACRLNAALLTVHAAGGAAMLRAAAQAKSGPTRLLAVSVLTSMDAAELRQTGVDGELGQVVRDRCRLAQQCGIDGAVLSAQELPLVEQLPADFLRVTPGIRAQGGGDDQARTLTAEQALAAGSSLLVIGRPIVAARHPRQAAEYFLQVIAASEENRHGHS